MASMMHAKCPEKHCDAHAVANAGEHILLQVKAGRESRSPVWSDLAAEPSANSSRHEVAGLDIAATKGSSIKNSRKAVNVVHQAPACRVNGVPASLSPQHDVSFVNYTDHHSNWGLQGLFVYPPSKFAFCLIEKNACSTWIQTVMQPLMRKIDTSKPVQKMEIDYNISLRSQNMFGVKGIEEVFHDPDATRAVFVREPLERFASAFMNKCLGSDTVNCPTNAKTFRGIVEWALQTDLTDTSLNGHWLLQSHHCELHKRIQGYNVIGLIEEATFARDMTCVLTRAGLDGFVQSSRDVPTANRGELNTTKVLQKLFTPDAARQLIAHMHDDYDLFGLPTPAWVTGATGEWFEKAPVPREAFLEMKAAEERSNLAALVRETEDLVDLAHDVGYVS